MPVQHFLVEYRRNGTSSWQRAQPDEERHHLVIANSTVSPERRFHIVRNLESLELYEFRVAGSNEVGTGDFQHIDELLLSHEIGVPSPPSQPYITGWKEGCVTIAANLSKIGFRQDFLIGYILILNDTLVRIVTGLGFQGNHSLGEQVEITAVNISYRGDWQFAVLASNSIGYSLPSEPSLRGEHMWCSG
jgi:hypothetical protein